LNLNLCLGRLIYAAHLVFRLKYDLDPTNPVFTFISRHFM